MGKEKYTPRGINDEKLLSEFTSGIYKAMLDIITADKELDIQIRVNYVNVYYKSGNIARIKSPNGCVEFDEYYFLREGRIPEIPQIEGKHKVNVKGDKKRGIEPQHAIIEELKSQRDKLKDLFRRGEYEEYFRQAKEAMDGWFEWNPRGEKKEQQQIVHRNNAKDDTEFYVLDVEYQISILAPFYYVKAGESDKQTSPRFDIIAVDKNGQLYVIELKKGCKACTGKAGLAAHKRAFDNSIGRAPEKFVKEFKKILEQKKSFQIADENIFIDDKKDPIFVFAYADYANETIKDFESICKKENVENVGILKCCSDHKLERYKCE